MASVLLLLACGGGDSSGDDGEASTDSGSDDGAEGTTMVSDSGGGDGDGSGSGADGDGTGGDADGGDGTGGSDDGGTFPPCNEVGPWPAQTTVWLVSRDLMGNPLNSASLPSVSGDGRFVPYVTNIDPFGSPGGLGWQAYVYDASCDTITLVPYDAPEDPVTEVIWTAISGDGLVVAFHTRDSNFNAFVHAWDRVTDTIEPISVGPDGPSTSGLSERPVLSWDGRFVAFTSNDTLHPDDMNAENDVYLRDRELGTTELISRATDGTVGDRVSQFPSISGDGRFVAFESLATNLATDDASGFDVFVRDRELDVTELASPNLNTNTAGSSNAPSISTDGRHVAFQSDSDELIPDPPTATIEVFVYDRDLGTVERVSLDDDGNGLTENAWAPRISGDGQRVLFTIGVLTGGGNDGQAWLGDRTAGTLTQVSLDAQGDPASHDVVNMAISSSGEWAVFESRATNFTDPPELGAGWDAFAVALP